jgi:hypothetical protein
MDDPTEMLLRAFSLAQTGRFATAREVRSQLRAEGFSESGLNTLYDTFSTRYAVDRILKSRFISPPPFSWISK